MANSAFAFVRWAVAWDALDDMQDFATRYCRRRWSGDLADRARLAACELLENAVRYATAGSEVALTIVDTAIGFELRVTNDAVESRVALLRKRIEETSSPGAGDAYRKALRKLLSETGEHSAASGLGLLRLRHEAGVDLALEVQGKKTTVIATATSASWPGAWKDEPTGPHKQLKEGHGKVR